MENIRTNKVGDVLVFVEMNSCTAYSPMGFVLSDIGPSIMFSPFEEKSMSRKFERVFVMGRITRSDHDTVSFIRESSVIIFNEGRFSYR